MPDLTDRIAELANGPAAASSPAGSVTAQSVDAAIKADQYLAGKRVAAAASAGGGFLGRTLRRAKVVLPDALGS